MNLRFGKVTKIGKVLGDDNIKTKVDTEKIYRAGQHVATVERYEIRVKCMSEANVSVEFNNFLKFIRSKGVSDATFSIEKSDSGEFYYAIKSYTKSS